MTPITPERAATAIAQAAELTRLRAVEAAAEKLAEEAEAGVQYLELAGRTTADTLLSALTAYKDAGK